MLSRPLGHTVPDDRWAGAHLDPDQGAVKLMATTFLHRNGLSDMNQSPVMSAATKNRRLVEMSAEKISDGGNRGAWSVTQSLSTIQSHNNISIYLSIRPQSERQRDATELWPPVFNLYSICLFLLFFKAVFQSDPTRREGNQLLEY